MPEISRFLGIIIFMNWQIIRCLIFMQNTGTMKLQ